MISTTFASTPGPSWISQCSTAGGSSHLAQPLRDVLPGSTHVGTPQGVVCVDLTSRAQLWCCLLELIEVAPLWCCFAQLVLQRLGPHITEEITMLRRTGSVLNCSNQFLTLACHNAELRVAAYSAWPGSRILSRPMLHFVDHRPSTMPSC